MCSQELPIVNDIHKATVLSDASQKHLNTDGTDLQDGLEPSCVHSLGPGLTAVSPYPG